MKIASRICVAAALLSIANSAGAADDPKPLEKSFDLHVKPFLKRYCMRCHNVDKMSSGVRVDHLNSALEDNHLRLWEALRKQIGNEAMPPEDEDQPTGAERTRVVEWIKQALDVAR